MQVKEIHPSAPKTVRCLFSFQLYLQAFSIQSSGEYAKPISEARLGKYLFHASNPACFTSVSVRKPPLLIHFGSPQIWAISKRHSYVFPIFVLVPLLLQTWHASCCPLPHACVDKCGQKQNFRSENSNKKCSRSKDQEHFVLNQEEITSSGTPQQQQPRKRSYRPWGCYLRPGSPSSQRKIRLSAAFRLRRRDFWSGKPDFSQNKKHIARKRYVVLSFYGDILSHHVFTKQDL